MTTSVVVSALVVASTGGVGVASASPTCTDSWTNASGGTWTTAADWSRHAAPTSDQAACLTIPLKAPVVLSGAATVKGLTVGGSKGTTELELDGATLTLNAKSTIEDSGTLAEQGYASSIAIRSPATLTNDGLLTVGPGYQLAITGNLTNASDGLVYLPANGYNALLELDGTSTFVNYGEVALQYNSEIIAPYNAKATATIDNAGGTIQNAGTIDVNAGGVFNEGAGTVTGSAPVVTNAILQLTGSGPSSFKLEGATTVSGTVAAAQTLQLGSGSASTKTSLTNDGVIVTTYYSTLSLPRGDTLFNYGSVISGPGTSLALVGNVDNEQGGTITVGGNAGYGSSLYLEAPYTLTNDGAFSVQTHSQVLAPFNSGTGLVFDNDGGTISNAGAFNVKPGGTFKEGAGTTTGNAIFVPGGAVEFAGSGAASFEMTGGALSGNIAADQTVAVVAPLGGNSIKVPASFTNDGTIFLSKGAINLPVGGTLTNNGLIECQDGSSNSLNGNLTNDAHGIVNLDGLTSYSGQLLLPLANTTFDNAGTIDLLYGSTIILQSWTQTFNNTGTINVGASPSGGTQGDTPWGGTAFDGSPITASTTNVASQENTIKLGGTINPVLVGGLPTPYPKSPKSISYGLFEASDGGDKASVIHLSCSASVTGGWGIYCSTAAGGVANLIAKSSTTRDPTTVSLKSSSPMAYVGNYKYPTSSYGQPVVFTATVTGGATYAGDPGSSSWPAPTGEVIFYNDSNNNDANANVLGTGTLSTKHGVTTATLTTSDLGPVSPGSSSAGTVDTISAYYVGDAKSLGTSSTPVGQAVDADTTRVSVHATPNPSYFAAPTTLKATVTSIRTGPAHLTGSVEFFTQSGSIYLGSAPVSTTAGVATATTTTTALPAGTDLITADYTGDANYTASTSSSTTQTVQALGQPRRH